MTIQVPFVPSDLSGDDVYARVAALYGNGIGEIDSESARVIASWWQSPGSIGHVLAGFASGAAVERAALLDDISATMNSCGYFDDTMEARDRNALDCLATFVINYGRDE